MARDPRIRQSPRSCNTWTAPTSPHVLCCWRRQPPPFLIFAAPAVWYGATPATKKIPQPTGGTTGHRIVAALALSLVLTTFAVLRSNSAPMTMPSNLVVKQGTTSYLSNATSDIENAVPAPQRAQASGLLAPPTAPKRRWPSLVVELDNLQLWECGQVLRVRDQMAAYGVREPAEREPTCEASQGSARIARARL